MEFLHFVLYSSGLFVLRFLVHIHAGIVNLAHITNVQVFTMYLILHFGSGLVGALFYRFGAHGPANPNGETEEERKTFWLIVLTGLIGCSLSLVAVVENLFSGTKIAVQKRGRSTSQADLSTKEYPPLTDEELRKFM